jgi:hypothetical protein
MTGIIVEARFMDPVSYLFVSTAVKCRFVRRTERDNVVLLRQIVVIVRLLPVRCAV